MIEGRRVVVVVPAFEERAHVGKVIATMPSFVDRVVVVDDGSTDGTGEAARAAARTAADDRLTVVRHDRRRGVGAAISTGYREAIRVTSHEHDAFAVMAGDGQMHPEDLAAVVLPTVRGEAAYVKGVRFGAEGVRRTMGTPRWIGGLVFSALTSAAIGQRVTDSQCGYTALARSAALALDLDGLWTGFGYPNDRVSFHFAKFVLNDDRIADIDDGVVLIGLDDLGIG